MIYLSYLMSTHLIHLVSLPSALQPGGSSNIIAEKNLRPVNLLVYLNAGQMQWPQIDLLKTMAGYWIQWRSAPGTPLNQESCLCTGLFVVAIKQTSISTMDLTCSLRQGVSGQCVMSLRLITKCRQRSLGRILQCSSIAADGPHESNQPDTWPCLAWVGSI